MKSIASLCSQITKFINRQKIPKNSRERLKEYQEFLESLHSGHSEIQEIWIRGGQDILNLKKKVNGILEPDEKRWRDWTPEEFSG